MFLYVCYKCSYNNINKLKIQNHLNCKWLCKDLRKNMLDEVYFNKYILLQQLTDKSMKKLR
jgi:hypothetical protein